MMNDSNKTTLTGLIRTLVAVLVAGSIVFIIFNLITKKQSDLLLVSQNPVPHTVGVPSDTNIVFTFNKQLLDNLEEVTINTAPKFDYSVSVEGNSITIYPLTTLMDSVTYNISLENVKAFDESLLDIASNTFSVVDNSKRGVFLRSLPLSGDGYTIARISDDIIYIQITKQPIDKITASINNLLRDSNITSDLFTIKIEALRSLSGQGAPATPSSPLPPGE